MYNNSVEIADEVYILLIYIYLLIKIVPHFIKSNSKQKFSIPELIFYLMLLGFVAQLIFDYQRLISLFGELFLKGVYPVPLLIIVVALCEIIIRLTKYIHTKIYPVKNHIILGIGNFLNISLIWILLLAAFALDYYIRHDKEYVCFQYIVGTELVTNYKTQLRNSYEDPEFSSIDNVTTKTHSPLTNSELSLIIEELPNLKGKEYVVSDGYGNEVVSWFDSMQSLRINGRDYPLNTRYLSEDINKYCDVKG